jgi:hypothetical protein
MTPNVISTAVTTTAVLTGDHLYRDVRVDLDDDEPPVLGDSIGVTIDGVTLAAAAVMPVDAQTIDIVVPPGLAVGTHAITVVVAGGMADTLESAVTVVGCASDCGDGECCDQLGETEDTCDADCGCVEDCGCDDGCGTCDNGCCVDTCGGGDCTLGCDSCDCTLDCSSTTGTCTTDCGSGASCDIDCSSTNNCEPTCDGAGTTCDISCVDANNCDKLRCENGAECIVDCAGANNCFFDACDGGETNCGGDVIVCNRPCP